MGTPGRRERYCCLIWHVCSSNDSSLARMLPRELRKCTLYECRLTVNPFTGGNNSVKCLEMILFHIRRYINQNYYYYYLP